MLAISPWEPDTCRGSIHILVPWLKCRIPQAWFCEELGGLHVSSVLIKIFIQSFCTHHCISQTGEIPPLDFARPPPLLALLVL